MGDLSEITHILIDFAVPLVLKPWWMVAVWGAWGILEEETVLWIQDVVDQEQLVKGGC